MARVCGSAGVRSLTLTLAGSSHRPTFLSPGQPRAASMSSEAPGLCRREDRKLLIVEKEGRKGGSSPGRQRGGPSSLAASHLVPAGSRGGGGRGVAWQKCVAMATVAYPLHCLSQALCSVHRFWQESARSESGLEKQRGSAKPTAAGTGAASPNRPARQETSQRSILLFFSPPSRPPGTSRATTSCKRQGFYRARRS